MSPLTLWQIDTTLVSVGQSVLKLSGLLCFSLLPFYRWEDKDWQRSCVTRFKGSLVLSTMTLVWSQYLKRLKRFSIFNCCPSEEPLALIITTLFQPCSKVVMINASGYTKSGKFFLSFFFLFLFISFLHHSFFLSFFFLRPVPTLITPKLTEISYSFFDPKSISNSHNWIRRPEPWLLQRYALEIIFLRIIQKRIQ
jgi:hypothetical protein